MRLRVGHQPCSDIDVVPLNTIGTPGGASICAYSHLSLANPHLHMLNIVELVRDFPKFERS